MKRPLRAILIILVIAVIILQINFFTGAATTQSYVTIMPAPTPPTPGPAPAPAAPGVPEEILPPSVPAEKIHYIGDFAVRRIYSNVTMAPEEVWIYTFKGVNHTIEPVYIGENYAEFLIRSGSLHLKIFVGETVQIDSDLNGYSDVKITLNSIKDGKVDVTLEIPFEEMVRMQITETPAVYYALLILVALLVIDTIIHHRKAKHIFKHTGIVQR